MAKKKRSLIPVERIERSILWIRDEKVILDAAIAALYGVETRVLVQAVKRNIDRFPGDFMFRLTKEEFDALRSDSAASGLISQSVTSKTPGPRGGRQKLPHAFTEQGVAMLSGVLRSPRAVEVNVEIMRAFVRLRRMIGSHKQLARKARRSGTQVRRPVQDRLRCHPRLDERTRLENNAHRLSLRISRPSKEESVSGGWNVGDVS